MELHVVAMSLQMRIMKFIKLLKMLNIKSTENKFLCFHFLKKQYHYTFTATV